MVLFLCSDLAPNTTGGQFVVDGGRTATGGAVTNVTARCTRPAKTAEIAVDWASGD